MLYHKGSSWVSRFQSTMEDVGTLGYNISAAERDNRNTAVPIETPHGSTKNNLKNRVAVDTTTYHQGDTVNELC